MADSPIIYPEADAIERLLCEAQTARTTRDWTALIRIGDLLERLGSYAEAWLALTESAEIRNGTILPNWGGPGTPGKRLLIRRRIRHLGAELRNARFIGCALRDVAEVIVATEARLIPLLKRSFPAAEFVAIEAISTINGADVECSYERLAFHYGADRHAISDTFVPLIPPLDTARVPEGVGIAWHSTSSRKLLPTIGDWSAVLASIEQPLRSLQYDEEEAGIDRLAELSKRAVRRSMPINQIIDVDGFAGQVASVGAVLTISNTTAHMAGALGVPCAVIVDDMPHLTWPARGTASPFYPNLRIFRRKGRPWTHVIEEGFSALTNLANI